MRIYEKYFQPKWVKVKGKIFTRKMLHESSYTQWAFFLDSIQLTKEAIARGENVSLISAISYFIKPEYR